MTASLPLPENDAGEHDYPDPSPEHGVADSAADPAADLSGVAPESAPAKPRPRRAPAGKTPARKTPARKAPVRKAPVRKKGPSSSASPSIPPSPEVPAPVVAARGEEEPAGGPAEARDVEAPSLTGSVPLPVSEEQSEPTEPEAPTEPTEPEAPTEPAEPEAPTELAQPEAIEPSSAGEPGGEDPATSEPSSAPPPAAAAKPPRKRAPRKSPRPRRPATPKPSAESEPAPQSDAEDASEPGVVSEPAAVATQDLAPDPEAASDPQPSAETASELELERELESQLALAPDVAPETELELERELGFETLPAPEAASEPSAVAAAAPAESLPSVDAADVEADAGADAAADAGGEADAGAAADADTGTGAEADADAGAEAPALRLRGLTKSFGRVIAVDRIDLTIRAGSFYGIVGPNGAGKTTTLSLIAGMLRPDAGSIEVAGIDLRADPVRAKRQMGILPDRLRTFDRLTGRQLLHYYGTLRGLRAPIVESRVADLAHAFDLTDALGRTVADYSTGMTKKLMLAGAMIHSPRVLVLDEPFESVDPVSSSVILGILSAYVSHGGTVVLSSHGMDLVERVCDDVAVIVAGRVLAQGTLDEVRGGLTLEQRFIELIGGASDVEGLEWLHTFSD
ncbi:MAG: ATP-binding cassette domain-containing protein [Microbacterium sp.]